MKKLFILCFVVAFATSVNAQGDSTAKVAFLRTFNYFGCGIGYNVYTGSTKSKVVRMKPQTFQVVDLKAHSTRFWAKTEVERHLDLDLKPNHIYFVRCKAGLGLLLYRPTFETLTVQEFEKLVSKKRFLQKRLKEMGFETIDSFLSNYQSIQLSSL